MTPQEEAAINTSVPDPGQLVEVRRRHWTVKDVKDSAFKEGKRQTLVVLESLDEDSQGEELRAIWQIEPGARIVSHVGLPEMRENDNKPFDTNEELEAFMNAVRWSAITNADRTESLQAPFRSGIAIKDYQLDPLVRSLNMSRVNLLIADDVGLGKTIEAGLVIQELLLRCRARTVFVVCPASLQIKWKEEMLAKFGLEFRIVDTAYLRGLRRERGINVNPWTSYPRLITSMDWIKSGEGYRLLNETLPLQSTYPRIFDILVVDEAHNVAPAGYENDRCSKPSLRTRVIQRMTPHFTHKLFLSATPHNGYHSSFCSLLELLDDQRFSRSILPPPEKVQTIMTRRLKTDLLDEQGNPQFQPRKIEALRFEYSEEERETSRMLQQFITSLIRGNSDATARMSAEFVGTLLKKRFYSSPAAFAKTLEKYAETLRNGKKRKKERPDAGVLRRAVERAGEDVRDESENDEATADALALSADATAALTDEQNRLLDKLLAWANEHANRGGSKEQAILNWLDEHIRPNGVWNDERVILFTEYLDTFKALADLLISNGFYVDDSDPQRSRMRLQTITGATKEEERERIKAEFQADPRKTDVRILLATDAASEGIDLQNHCHYMIHVEIPWNPNVMEQRNGRIDRYGQRFPVEIWHPVGGRVDSNINVRSARPGDLEGDMEYLLRAVRKVDAIRADLGSAGAVVAKQIQSVMLGESTFDESFDSPETDKKKKKSDLYVKTAANVRERIQKLHDRLDDSIEKLELTPENIASAVQVALKLAQQPALKPKSADGNSGEPHAKDEFLVPDLTGSWSDVLAELPDPVTQERRSITFNAQVAEKRDDVVLEHLNSVLVKKSLRLLREELWSQSDVRKLSRVAFRVSDAINAPVAIVFSRLVVTGGDARRLHEEMILSGGELRKDLTHRRVDAQKTLVEFYRNSRPLDAPDSAIVDEMRRRFNSCAKPLVDSVVARVKDRANSLESVLQKTKEKEIEDVSSLLDELERTLDKELHPEKYGKEPKPRQLLFDEFMEMEQRDQIKRDDEALEQRLARIPQERLDEKSAIERRYENVKSRAFPAAVFFIVPDNFNREEGN